MERTISAVALFGALAWKINNMQAYSDPTREEDPFALPDVEVFYVSAQDFLEAEPNTWMREGLDAAMENIEYNSARVGAEIGATLLAADQCKGWYYWFCFPGCLPDSEPYGPFETEEEAIADAQGQNE